MGDIILTTPVVRCLATQMPDAEIHYLTRKGFAPLLSDNPYIRKVIAFDGNLHNLIPILKAEGYTHIVDLHKSLRSGYILLRLYKSFSTFSKLNFRKWLLVKWGINVLPSVHISERYLKAVERFGVVNDGRGLDLFISPADEVDLRKFPAVFQQGYNGMVIGGKHHTKIFPVDKVIEVIGQSALPVILLGGGEDHQNGEIIRTAMGDKVYNACGEFSIMQSASLVRQARAIACNDTGLMHMAAAFNKNIVSIWGNTVPEFGMYPYMPGVDGGKSFLSGVQGLTCRPCSRIGFARCPKGHFRCMKDQDTGKIADYLNDFAGLS
jgi:ADP-heptose:LPS heptosyltransferase